MAEPVDIEVLAEELAELLGDKETEAPALDLLKEERFGRFEIGVALARRAARLQGVDPGRCARLAGAASFLCAWQVSDEAAAEDQSERVRALVGNALRLQGNGEEALMLMTWHRQLPRARGGELFRAQGLVHWELSQLTEAVALLGVANGRFNDQRARGEALATRELRVLLHAEMGESFEALRLYASCSSAEPPAARPWLSARTALTAAFCLAERDDAGDRSALRRALHRGGELASVVTDERERLTLSWLVARAEARQTSDARRAEALDALREPVFHLLGWHDYALLTLDLFACRAGSSHLEVDRLRQELWETAPSEEDFHHLLRGYLPETGHAGLAWWEAGFIGRILRSRCRGSGRPGLRPLPFLVPWPRPDKAPHDREPS